MHKALILCRECVGAACDADAIPSDETHHQMSSRGILVLLAALLVVTDAALVGQYAVRQAYRLRGSFPVFGRPYSLSDQAASASFTVQFPQVYPAGQSSSRCSSLPVGCLLPADPVQAGIHV